MPSHPATTGQAGAVTDEATAAAAACDLSPELVASLLDRAARPDFDLLQHRLKGTGWCARPVRLRGVVCEPQRHRGLVNGRGT